MRVADLLKTKGPHVVTIRSSETMGTAARRMRAETVGSIVVIHGDGVLDGILSERDVVHGLATHGADLDHRPVSEFMVKSVTTCAPDDAIDVVARMMTRHRLRHLPVLDDDRLVGLISIGDVLKYRIEELLLEANVMRDYAIAAAR